MPIKLQQSVLAVDDEQIVRETFDRAFLGQEDRFILHTAENVEVALHRIAVLQYDLIFLDMKLNYATAGMEVLEELRRQEIKLEAEGVTLHPTKVIIMSSSICLNDISAVAHGLGVFSFIDKTVPFTEDFVRKVVNHFGLPLLPRRTR